MLADITGGVPIWCTSRYEVHQALLKLEARHSRHAIAIEATA
jgi:hypothetical protein